MDTTALVETTQEDASLAEVQAAWDELQAMPSYVEVQCAEFAAEEE